MSAQRRLLMGSGQPAPAAFCSAAPAACRGKQQQSSNAVELAATAVAKSSSVCSAGGALRWMLTHCCALRA